MAVSRQGTLLKLMSTKKIGFLGAVTLLFNAATGPGVPFTAANFQNPGWLFTVVMFILFTIVSGFCILFIVEAMQAIPGNRHFQGNVEYATLINFYFGPWMHIAGQIFLYGALQSNAIQNIILSAQATDNLLILIFGKTCGFSLGKPTVGWMCVAETGDLPSPFGNTFMLFTLGFLVILALVIPLGMSNLDDNIMIQIVSFSLSFLIVAQWDVSAILNGLQTSRMPRTAPPNLSYGQTVGTIMLNLAVTTVVPSWINIKAKDVNVQQVVWTALWSVTGFFICSNVFLAMGYDIDDSNNILHSLMVNGVPSSLTKATVFMFAYVMLVPSIPVSLIISKDNLVQNKIVSPRMGQFLTFFLPWLICIPLQTGTVLFLFQTWTSLIFVSMSSFILPLLIYFKCLKFRKVYNSDRVLSQNQLNLLKEIHRTSSTITTFISTKSALGIGKELRPRNGELTPLSMTSQDEQIPDMSTPSVLPSQDIVNRPSEATLANTFPNPDGQLRSVQGSANTAPALVIEPASPTNDTSAVLGKLPSAVSFSLPYVPASSTVVMRTTEDHVPEQDIIQVAEDQFISHNYSSPVHTADLERGSPSAASTNVYARRRLQPEWLREDVPDPEEEDRIYWETIGRKPTFASLLFSSGSSVRQRNRTATNSPHKGTDGLHPVSNSTWTSPQKASSDSPNPLSNTTWNAPKTLFRLSKDFVGHLSLPRQRQSQEDLSRIGREAVSAVPSQSHPLAFLDMTTGNMPVDDQPKTAHLQSSASFREEDKSRSRSNLSVSFSTTSGPLSAVSHLRTEAIELDALANQEEYSPVVLPSGSTVSTPSPATQSEQASPTDAVEPGETADSQQPMAQDVHQEPEYPDEESLPVPSGVGYNNLLPLNTSGSTPSLNTLGSFDHPKGKLARRRLPNDKTDLSRLVTLPANPRFRSPAFRSVPRWMPIRGVHMAWGLFLATTIVTVVNIGLNVLSVSSS